MRTAGLLLLAILFPAFAHAADSTWFKTYTISNNTICPSAPNVCPASTSIDIEFYNPVKNASIYIGTSDSPILIYKNTSGVTNPKAYPWDGTVDNKNGVIMPDGIYTVSVSATLADGSEVKDTSRTITISSTVGANNNDASTTGSSVQEQTGSSSSSSGSATTPKSPPSALTVEAGVNRDAVMKVPLHLFARAMVKGGAVDPSARITWGFGDGSSAEGTTVEKAYLYAGSYLVVVTATDGQATGRGEFIVTVRPAQVRILEVPDTGVMIINDMNERLDISGWALFADRVSFRIPDGTVILPKASVILPSTVTKLPTALEVVFAYPDGGIAARYVVSPEPIARAASVSAFDAQLSSRTASYEQVQKVEPIISVKENVPEYAEAVGAPAAANELAAAGAVLPSNETAPAANARAAGIFKSPWTLSFLGVVILAGSAFIFL